MKNILKIKKPSLLNPHPHLVDEGEAVDVIHEDFLYLSQYPPAEADSPWFGQVHSLLAKENWLEGQAQRVVVKGAKSNWQPIMSDVPKQSVLEPALFKIFI